MPYPIVSQPPKSRIESGLLAWKLTKFVHQGRRPIDILQKGLGGFVNAFLYHEYFSDWVNFLIQPEILAFTQTNRWLWIRTFRGYVSTEWKQAKLVKVLKDSYRFALLHPGPVKDVLIGSLKKEITIAEVPLNDENGTIRFTISQDNRFKREGEWTVRVHCDKIGGELCSVAFSVEEVNGQWIAYAGAIQGGSGANEETIKASWKAMHGVRAKAMAIFALQEVVSALGVSRLLGAGNAIQMSSGKHMISVPWNKISFNYNQMWEEADGKAVEEGWFELPLREIRRSREEIKTNKRALYARRYALFDQLSTAVTQSLSTK